MGPQFTVKEPEMGTSTSFSFHFHFLQLLPRFPTHSFPWGEKTREQINSHWHFFSVFSHCYFLSILSLFIFHLSSCLSVSCQDWFLEAPLHGSTVTMTTLEWSQLSSACVWVCLREREGKWERDKEKDGDNECGGMLGTCSCLCGIVHMNKWPCV